MNNDNNKGNMHSSRTNVLNNNYFSLITKKSVKSNKFFIKKNGLIILIMIISFILLSSISFASDATDFSKKFTFIGDNETSTNNNHQYDSQELNESKIEIEPLETNITAQVINNTLYNVTIEINVSDINNNTVNNGTITIKSHDEILKDNVTVENGTEIIDLSFETPGDYELLIIYNPTEEYRESQFILSFNLKDDMSSKNNQLDDTSINQKDSTSNTETVSLSNTSNYIGNANSGKFHSISCSEVNRMNENNKVSFNSREDAVNNGYIPCKKCNP